MGIRARLAIGALLGSAVLAIAGPALAQTSPAARDHNAFVVVTGRLEVRTDDIYDAAVILDGPLLIDGTVVHDAVAFNGDVIVMGSVGGNVVSLGGRVVVRQGAHVGGDVTSREAPEVAPGTVDGRVSQGANLDVRWARVVGRGLLWLIMSGSVFLLGLLLTLVLPRAADSSAEVAVRRVGPSAGWGAAGFFGLPLVGILVLATVVAGAAGLGLLLALLLIYIVSYTVGANALGRSIVKPPRHRFLAFLAGFAILRGAALVPVLGGLLFVLTAGWGLGAIIVAGFRAGRGRAEPPAVAGAPQAMAGPPPMPPMPSPP
jgi:hypothetical protein